MIMRRMIDSLRNADGGSMILEYALMLSVGVVFVFVAIQIFEPGVGFTEDLGKPLVAYFQRVLTGIALPVP